MDDSRCWVGASGGSDNLEGGCRRNFRELPTSEALFPSPKRLSLIAPCDTQPRSCNTENCIPARKTGDNYGWFFFAFNRKIEYFR
jgi:hypothetical protein